ncbi:MAG TPA: lysophospholipid acyltransferase family protein [Azospira sp.]|nr:lysophospholipid acyltransferase family protein [Azospira sp.]
MALIRSILFSLLAIPLTALFGALVCLTAPLSVTLAYGLIDIWRGIFLQVLVRRVLGIRTEVRGVGNIPKEAAVVLSKHQSAWETVALQQWFPRMVFVLKKELLKLPFLGWAFAAIGMIAIDRKAGMDALAQVSEQGTERLGRGISVIIFPEGTRVAPGQKKRYKPGGAHLAVQAKAKVVPVAHNAGELWRRNAFIKHSGTITISFGPAIDASGLTAEELNRQVEAWIEGEMRQISPHRYCDGAKAGA